MAEILVKAVDAVHSNPDKDRRGAYKVGHPVVVMPDGHEWGRLERLPTFALIKIPGVSPDRLAKFIEQTGERRRKWRIRWADLPAGVRNKLRTTGELVIKAGGYDGPFDYTWAQVKGFFRDDDTGTDETGEL